MGTATRRDALLLATLGYLLLPNVVFALGWLRPQFALPLLVALAACALDAWRRATTDAPRPSRRETAIVLAFAVFWVVVAGIGELNLQTEDYLKHNLAFHDLVTRPWPVVYGHGVGGSPILCYYLAYYLPASLAGKLLGLGWTAPASFLWGLGGVTLAFAWVARLGRPRGLAVLPVFTLIDSFAWLPGLVPFVQRLAALPGATSGSWWTVDRFTERAFSFGDPPMRLLFQSEPSLLLWAPQHTLVAWLATACVLRTLDEGHAPRHLGLVLGATLLWSPFVTVGLLPFALAAHLRRPRSGASWPSLLGGAALAAAVGPYFLAHGPQQYLGFLPGLFAGPSDWLRYLGFLAASVGVIALALVLVRRRAGIPPDPSWRLFLLACAVLVAATLVYLGRQNDWAMRVSMPANAVFRLVAARSLVALWRAPALRRTAVAFALVLAASAERPLKIVVLAPFGRLGGQLPGLSIVTATTYASGLHDLPAGADWDFAGQYLGSPDGVFARRMMRVPGPEPSPPSP